MSTGPGVRCQALGIGDASREVDRSARGWIDGVAFVDAVPDDPDDLVAGANERDGVSFARGDFGIDKNVLKLLFAAEAQGAKAIAGAAGADAHVGASLVGVEVGLKTVLRGGSCRRWL